MKVTEIAAGFGLATRIGNTRVAVFNSGDGLTVLKNVCTHMGCETHWNGAESTWDCPCHGSRYHPDGTVLRGPAQEALTTLAYHVEGDELVLD